MSKAMEQAMPPSCESAESLAARFKAGDEDAFDALVRMHQRQVFSLAYRMLNDYADASDAAQEVFVKLHRALGAFRGASSFSTWVYAIAANTCRNWLRSRVRHRNLEVRNADLGGGDGGERWEPEAVDPAPRPDEALQGDEGIRRIEAALAGLPREFAMVIVMRDVQDMTYEEIARALRCSMGTVKSRLARARMMARRRLAGMLAERAGQRGGQR